MKRRETTRDQTLFADVFQMAAQLETCQAVTTVLVLAAQ
jgi:hypothetical protein